MAKWTPGALEAVKHMKWESFNASFPEYSFDAFEVKRRRVKKGDAPEPEGAGLVPVPAATGYVGPTIAFFDIETTFSTQPRMLTTAIMDGHGDTQLFDLINSAGTNWLDDRELAVAVRDALEAYTIVCGWNSKLFDVPVINGRLAYHGERPLRLQMHVDLMYYATGQFMRIGRKSLESVSTFFKSPNRKTPLNPAIWDRADHGDMEAYDLIREHNLADVAVTRDVWAHLSPHIRTIHRAG